MFGLGNTLRDIYTYACSHAQLHRRFSICICTHMQVIHTWYPDWSAYTENTKPCDPQWHNRFYIHTHKQTLSLISVCQVERWKRSLTCCTGVILLNECHNSFPSHMWETYCICVLWSLWQIENETVIVWAYATMRVWKTFIRTIWQQSGAWASPLFEDRLSEKSLSCLCALLRCCVIFLR